MKNLNQTEQVASNSQTLRDLALRAKVAQQYGQAGYAFDELVSLLMTPEFEARAARKAANAVYPAAKSRKSGANAGDSSETKVPWMQIHNLRAAQIGRDAWVDIVCKLEVFLRIWDHEKTENIADFLLGAVVRDWEHGLVGYFKQERSLVFIDHIQVVGEELVDTLDDMTNGEDARVTDFDCFGHRYTRERHE